MEIGWRAAEAAEPYSVTMSDGTPASDPPRSLAGRRHRSRRRATARRRAVRPRVVSTYREPPISRFWARLDSPFGVGFLLTLGGLGALAIGAAFINLSTIFIYIAFAMFAALGLDPVIKFLERHNVKRGLAVLIVFFVFAVVVIGLLWLVVPTLVAQITSFIDDFPQTVQNFQDSDFFHVARGHLRHGPLVAGDRRGELPHGPEEHRRHRGRCPEDRRRHRDRRLRRAHRRRADALLRALARGHQGVVRPVRRRPQPPEGAQHDRPDHRVGRRLPDGHGDPGVLQLGHRLHAAPRPRAAVPAADGRARVLHHDHPARRPRALLDHRHDPRAVHAARSRP